MTPLVSIIIPAFNASAWIAQTIDSALAQTWSNIEIIVVNDGSSDDTLDVARRYESERLRLITQTNAGAAAARNTGIRAASGKFIQYLDADDLLAPEKIATQLAELAMAPAGSIASGPWGTFRDDLTQASFKKEPVWENLTACDWLVLSWSGGGMFPPLVWLTPKRIIDESGPWNEALSLDDDGEYFCRILLHSSEIRFTPGALSYYRAHDGPRLSATRGRRAALSSLQSIELKDQHVLSREDSPRMRRALAFNYQRYIWEQIVDAPDLAAHANARLQTLDATLPQPEGPRFYRWAAKLFGWRGARRLQLAAKRLLNR